MTYDQILVVVGCGVGILLIINGVILSLVGSQIDSTERKVVSRLESALYDAKELRTQVREVCAQTNRLIIALGTTREWQDGQYTQNKRALMRLLVEELDDTRLGDDSKG